MELAYIRERWKLKPGDAAAETAVWDSTAEEYLFEAKNNFEEDPFLRFVAEKTALTKNMRTLDVGCGAGAYSVALAKQVGQADGVDLSPRMVALGNAWAQEHGIGNLRCGGLRRQRQRRLCQGAGGARSRRRVLSGFRHRGDGGSGPEDRSACHRRLRRRFQLPLSDRLHRAHRRRARHAGARRGCGVGKYGTYLAELGYDVTLTDISEKMLEHARENMAKYRTPWAVYRCDFREATGGEPVFAGGFDLAISTMSPAVCDAATVQKMSGMTRGWCFLARFCDWEQPFRDTLLRELGMEPHPPFRDLKGDCASMLQAVAEAGFIPRVRVVDYNWADRRTPEQMAETMLRTFFSGEDTVSLRDELLRLARSHAGEDGTVLDAVNTKVNWIYWKTEDKT